MGNRARTHTGVLQHFTGIKINDSYNHAIAKELAAVGAEVLLKEKGALVHHVYLLPPAQISSINIIA